jgi:hypothetical protein
VRPLDRARQALPWFINEEDASVAGKLQRICAGCRFPQLGPGPILMVPRPRFGPARARSCAGWCPPRGSALREHDHAQVGALPEVRPCASTIMRRLVPSPRFGQGGGSSGDIFRPRGMAAATGLHDVNLSSTTRVAHYDFHHERGATRG